MSFDFFQIAPERVTLLNQKPFRANCPFIVYRMQACIRVTDNLALAKAIALSRETGLPLKVVFHLNADFPDANYRHFCFLADGLREIAIRLAQMQIPFELLTGDFRQAMRQIADEAACMITDRGYLRIQREQLQWLANEMPCQVIAVEDNLMVPIESASPKAEWAARTLRPKLMTKVSYFSDDYARYPLSSQPFELAPFEQEKILSPFLEQVKNNQYLAPVALRGGESEALRTLTVFVNQKLGEYDVARNHPESQATSRLSAYLHFGMISPLTIYRQCQNRPEAAPFIEQLLVRRELAHNFIYYTPGYDQYNALPVWCRTTLAKHHSDQRPFLYDRSMLETASTHDACWNAAMREMLTTGYMENTMRMYWGKKIIEWSVNPEIAFQTILTLNNRYFLDGRDANSFTGVAWCFGLHDRPWTERNVFGTVRYMNEAGLRRKYDIEKYIALF